MELIIVSSKQKVLTADGSEIMYHPLLVHTGSGFRDLWDSRELDEIKDVSFVRSRRRRFYRLVLDQKILDAVVVFLEKYHQYQDMSFDCYAFANIVVGHKTHSKKLLLEFWSVQRYYFWRRRVGNVIFLMDNNAGNFSHAAVYIGYGYYISVHGAGGDLMVATLPDMVNCYTKTKDIMIASPII